MNTTKHITFLKMLEPFSKLSHCVSKQVSALIVKDGRIISTGINGTAPGYTNCDSIFDKNKFNRAEHHAFSEKYEIHAEMNAILFAASKGISLNGATLYCNLFPCWNCIKNISVTGIKQIVYSTNYDLLSKKDIDDIYNYCDKLGIEILHVDINGENNDK